MIDNNNPLLNLIGEYNPLQNLIGHNNPLVNLIGENNPLQNLIDEGKFTNLLLRGPNIFIYFYFYHKISSIKLT